MKYFISNISQPNILRTIFSIALGMFFWTYSLVQTDSLFACITTCVLAMGNSFLLSIVFSKLEITNLPSFFVATSYWLIISSLTFLHSYWQGQILNTSILLSLMIIGNVHHHSNAIEKSFLSTLIPCIASFWVPQSLCTILIIWTYLLSKRTLTWRCWFASIIAILLVTIYGGIYYFMGGDPLLLDRYNHPKSWYAWVIVIMLAYTFLITLLTIKKSNIISGIVYLSSIIILLIGGILSILI